MSDQVAAKPSRHHIWRIGLRTLSKSWDDSIFSESAQAGFWSALSTPPLLLGMLGALAYVAPLFGPDALPSIVQSAISAAHSLFSPSVVNEIIEPTIRDITAHARGEVVSLGFLLSLWAGSSAMSSFVDSVVEAHDQTPLRHPVRQRFFALFLYLVRLVVTVVMAPVAVRGSAQGVRTHSVRPGQRAALRLLPGADPRADGWGHPVVPSRAARTTADASADFRRRPGYGGVRHRDAGPARLPGWITSTGYTYGALSTPIAFLLFAFFAGFAIMIGAELNAAIQEEFPAPRTHAHRLRKWLLSRSPALKKTMDSLSNPVTTNPATQDARSRRQSRRPDQPFLSFS